MKKESDILIIGGGPAGAVCASTAQKYYSDKKITILRSIEQGVIPCGIPYMLSSLGSPLDDAMSLSALEQSGVSVVTDEVDKIDRNNKSIFTKNGDEYRYEKLVLALGSKPVVPPLKGMNLENVLLIYKDMNYLKNMVAKVKASKNVLIIGGGFIGVEFADEISKIGGISVHLVELLPHILFNSFDLEFSSLVQEKLENKGVKILTNTRVQEIIGNKKVEQVRFSNGDILDIDCVVLGIGARPNTQIAQEAGLDLGKGRGIWVDEYMRTVDPNIFAIGDCAGKRDFFTRRDTPVMLASIAAAEARIAGANLYKLKVVRENKGTIAIFSTYISGLVLGSVGLTETSAKKEGFEIIIGKYEGKDKHPAKLPGTSQLKLKLVFSRQSGILMGGQVAGGFSAGEIINIVGMAVQQRVTLTELETLQMATHPYLTPAPTRYHLVIAAQDALNNYDFCI